MNTLCIIQARIGSSRFPGKMTKKIANLMIIDWVIKRVKKSKKLKKIILATSKLKADDKLIEIAKKNKITSFRGSSEDVLGRFYKAALTYKPKFIVRICADNPFVDPFLLDKLVSEFKYKRFDYAFNHQSKLNNKCADGFGAEIMNFQVLKKLNKVVKKISQREHVTLYIWKNMKKFKIQSINSPKKISFPKLKFDVDTKKDLNKLDNFAKKNGISLNTRAEKIVSLYLKK